MRQQNADAAAETLGNAGYDVSAAIVDASSREAVEALVVGTADVPHDPLATRLAPSASSM